MKYQNPKTVLWSQWPPSWWNQQLEKVEKGNIKANKKDTYFPPECTIPGLQSTI
jgi:hypothetical protein